MVSPELQNLLLVVAEGNVSGTLKSGILNRTFSLNGLWLSFFSPITSNKEFKWNLTACERNASHVVLQLAVPWRQTNPCFCLVPLVSCLPLKREITHWKSWSSATCTLHYICFSLLQNYATFFLLFPYIPHKLFLPVVHVGKQMVQVVNNWLPRSYEIEFSQVAPPGTLYLQVYVSEPSC